VKGRGLAVLVLIVGLFMDLVDSTITNVALVSIQKSLKATATQLEWVLAAYMLAFGILLITGGRLGDIFGRQRVFMAGVAGFGLASLAAALAQNGDVLITARVVQGVFAALMVPQVLSTVQVLFEPEERAAIYGLIGAISALGAVVGLILGGWMVTDNAFGVGWRSIFIVNVPVCIALVVAAWFLVPNTRSATPVKLDPGGVTLAAGTAFLVIFPLIDGRRAHWAPWIWAMFLAAPFVGAAFVLQQRRRVSKVDSALLPLRLFANRGFSSGLVVQTLFWCANGSYMLIIGYYLQQALGFTPFRAGLTLFAMTVGAAVVTPAASALAKRAGKYAIVLGGLVQAGAFGWLMHTVSTHGPKLSAWHMVPPFALAGVGMVLLVVPLLDVALSTVEDASAGAASGVFNTFQQIGFALGLAIAGGVFFGRAGALPTFGTLRNGVVAGLWVTVLSFALAGLISLLLPDARIAGTAATEPVDGGTEPMLTGRKHLAH